MMSTKVVRTKPRNLESTDLNLFESELEREIKEPVLNVANYMFYDGSRKFFTDIERFNPTILLKRLRRKKRFYKSAIWIVDKWSSNYFHWLTEAAQKLFLVEGEGLTNVPILIPYQLYDIAFIKEFLSIYNQFNFRVVRGFELIIVKKMIIPSLNIQTGNYHEQLLQGFYSDHNTEKKPYRKIFIDRRDNLKRNIINGQEFKSLIKNLGFETVYPETLPLNEQKEIFSEAVVLMGVHGAGLTNMLFMKQGASVLELRKKADGHNNCYFSLASVTGLHYYYQMCETDHPGELTQHNNFYVDVNELKRNIELILSNV